MISKIQNFVEQQNLLCHEHRYLVAISGGADSVALLRVMLLLGYQVEAAHCNFHLRGKESDRDEQFVQQLCQQFSVKLHLAHFDTKAYAQGHHISIEMAARDLRYHYFRQLLHDLDLAAVCVAHHRDDSVETLLINLLRGTGIHGLTGICPKRDNEETGCVVRPLLCVGRQEIETWLHELGQSYVTDSTNLVDDVMRNQIRLNVIPILQQINPAAVENIQYTADLMRETESIYNAYTSSKINDITDNNSISISDLKRTASPLCFLFEWLSNYGFQPAVIQQIASRLDAQTGHFWQSATHELYIDRGRLLLTPIHQELSELRIPETGLYVCPDGSRLRFSQQQGVTILRTADKACLDAANVSFPLTIRQPRQGDRFVPYGMTGSRLVSDFLTDQKVPLPEKRRQLLVVNADGQIIWVVGRRPAAPFCVSEHTTETLLIEKQD